jgi:PAS domain S-box-containing protein
MLSSGLGNENRFRALADRAPVVVWIADRGGRCVWVNQAWLEFTGGTLEQQLGHGWADGQHPDDRAKSLARYAEHAGRREPFTLEYRLRRHDGVYRWLVDSGAPLTDDAGAFTGYVGSCIDVTPRHEAQQAAARANRMAQATLDALPEQVCVLDDQGVVLSVNRAWVEFGSANGAPAGCDYAGRSYLAVCATATGSEAEQARAFHAKLVAVLAGESAGFSMDYRCAAPGDERWFVARVSRFEEGGQARVVITHSDITARVAAEKLCEREARLAFAVRGSDLGIWDWDVATGHATVNERWAQLLGYSLDQVSANPVSWDSVVHPEDLPRVRRELDAHLRGETPSFAIEHRAPHRDGSWVWVLDCGAVVSRSADGAPTRLSGTLRDISAQKQSEAERKALLARTTRAERVAALGSMAIGMAHEINNPLSYAVAGIGFAQEQIGALPAPVLAAWTAHDSRSLSDVREALIDATEGALRVGGLVADLRAFATGSHGLDAVCRLVSVVDRALLVANHALSDGAIVSVDLGSVPAICASEPELVQLFAGLLVNAGQAKGQRPNRVSVTAEHQPPNVVVRVADTGTGISPDVLPRIFDPFFSTKGPGRGKGLGLSVALGIAQGLGGTIEVRSAVGEGTTVTVTLPVGGAKTSYSAL